MGNRNRTTPNSSGLSSHTRPSGILLELCLAAHLSESSGWIPANVKPLLPPPAEPGNSRWSRRGTKGYARICEDPPPCIPGGTRIILLVQGQTSLLGAIEAQFRLFCSLPVLPPSCDAPATPSPTRHLPPTGSDENAQGLLDSPGRNLRPMAHCILSPRRRFARVTGCAWIWDVVLVCHYG